MGGLVPNQLPSASLPMESTAEVRCPHSCQMELCNLCTHSTCLHHKNNMSVDSRLHEHIYEDKMQKHHSTAELTSLSMSFTTEVISFSFLRCTSNISHICCGRRTSLTSSLSVLTKLLFPWINVRSIQLVSIHWDLVW